MGGSEEQAAKWTLSSLLTTRWPQICNMITPTAKDPWRCKLAVCKKVEEMDLGKVISALSSL